MIRLLSFVLLLTAQPAFANHPGERLDEVMAEKEPSFEVTDLLSVPNDLEVVGQNGELLRLSDFRDQIVVLSFVPQACGGSCAEQQAALAAVQAQVNITPMKEMVVFATIQGSGAAIEAPWDDANWRLATLSSDTTAAVAADRFAELSNRDHALPMVHVIDRSGRHAGIFHGAEFERVNLTLYINGIINNAHAPKPPTEKSWWERLTDWF